MIAEPLSKAAGAEVDSRPCIVSAGICLVGAPLFKRLGVCGTVDFESSPTSSQKSLRAASQGLGSRSCCIGGASLQLSKSFSV